jgi:hypothetical protein
MNGGNSLTGRDIQGIEVPLREIFETVKPAGKR